MSCYAMPCNGMLRYVMLLVGYVVLCEAMYVNVCVYVCLSACMYACLSVCMHACDMRILAHLCFFASSEDRTLKGTCRKPCFEVSVEHIIPSDRFPAIWRSP